jgi:hypothetical protein
MNTIRNPYYLIAIVMIAKGISVAIVVIGILQMGVKIIFALNAKPCGRIKIDES